MTTETVHPPHPAGIPEQPVDPSGERTDVLTKKPLDLEGFFSFKTI